MKKLLIATIIVMLALISSAANAQQLKVHSTDSLRKLIQKGKYDPIKPLMRWVKKTGSIQNSDDDIETFETEELLDIVDKTTIRSLIAVAKTRHSKKEMKHNPYSISTKKTLKEGYRPPSQQGNGVVGFVHHRNNVSRLYGIILAKIYGSNFAG